MWNNISFKGAHQLSPAIVEVFDDNQERIKKEYQIRSRREASACRHWLSGVLRCSVCNSTLAYNRSNNQKKRGDIFQCWKYLKGVHPGSNSVSVKKAEQAVIQSLKEVLTTGEIDYEYIPDPGEESINQEALLKEALERVAVKERRIRDAYENGIDTIEEYRENKKRLQTERNQLTEELEGLQSLSGPDSQGGGKARLLERIQTIYQTLSDPDVDFETKGAAIRRVIKYIVYDRSTKTFRFYYYLS